MTPPLSLSDPHAHLSSVTADHLDAFATNIMKLKREEGYATQCCGIFFRILNTQIILADFFRPVISGSHHLTEFYFGSRNEAERIKIMKERKF